MYKNIKYIGYNNQLQFIRLPFTGFTVGYTIIIANLDAKGLLMVKYHICRNTN